MNIWEQMLIVFFFFHILISNSKKKKTFFHPQCDLLKTLMMMVPHFTQSTATKYLAMSKLFFFLPTIATGTNLILRWREAYTVSFIQVTGFYPAYKDCGGAPPSMLLFFNQI